jgi:la-related protein 6
LQVEFYFSDANILKDAFLLKHVRRNKQGYVSLKLITSFRKMKSLTKDYRVVAFSLRQSQELDVNEEGTKVKRKRDLPEYDETTPSRTVVAINLPMENPTMESVAELFSSCGEVVLLRILRPGKAIPPDVRKHINKHPEIGTTVCAVVEFENFESAKKATQSMSGQEDWRKGMHVMLLANTPQKDAKKDKKKDVEKKGARMKKLSADEHCGYLSSGSEMEHEAHKRRGSDDRRFMRSSLSPQQDPNRLSPSTTPRSSPRASPRGSPNARRRHIGKSPLAQDGLSPKVSPTGSPESRRRAELSGNESPSQSPWVQRRKAQAGSLSSSPMASPLLGRRAAEGVLRQPLGP